MASWKRRTLLTAGAAVPVLAVARAASASDPVGERSVAAPVASPSADLVVDPRTELGGADSVAPDAVGVLPQFGRVPSTASTVGSGRLQVAPRVGSATTAQQASSVPFTFRSTAFSVRSLPVSARPYALRTPEPLVDTGVHDATGVRMFSWQGRLHDHPVAQSQYGLRLLESHRLTGRAAYLDRAVKQAQRLLDRAVARGAARFYPYDFALNVHGSTDRLPQPWFSTMAQGQALSLFVRLFQVTRNARWKAAADAAFASFLLPFAAGRPWGVYVKDQLLRLEEYPSPAAAWGDQTYNGHVFASFGLYDYYQLTHQADALLLLQGAMTTARDLVARQRVPGWRSRYCLRHGADAGRYHKIHIEQQQMLQAITADEAFARTADALYHDFPPVTLGADAWTPAPVAFAAGAHTAYRFSATGGVSARRTLTFGRATLAHAQDRVRIKGRTGLWYLIADGLLKDWYVSEAPGHRALLGEHAVLAYPVARLATTTAARPATVTVTASGAVSSRPTSYPRGTRIWVDARGVLNGVVHLRVAAGTHLHRWIRTSDLSI